MDFDELIEKLEATRGWGPGDQWELVYQLALEVCRLRRKVDRLETGDEP